MSNKKRHGKAFYTDHMDTDASPNTNAESADKAAAPMTVCGDNADRTFCAKPSSITCRTLQHRLGGSIVIVGLSA